jgi:hypothetical protein
VHQMPTDADAGVTAAIDAASKRRRSMSENLLVANRAAIVIVPMNRF